MRTLVRIFALMTLFTGAAFAVPSEGEVTLTPDGVLYSIEQIDAAEIGSSIASQTVLRLTMETEESSRSTYVPESLMGGRHQDPTLLFDTESNTLFVFWVRHTSPTSGELMAASFRNDVWTSARLIDAGVMVFQKNLRIAVTRVARVEGEESSERVTGVHLVWWEESGSGEVARYALLQLEQGELRVVDVRDLLDFAADRSREPFEVPADADRSVLRFPSIQESGSLAGVEVVFGDILTNRFQRIEIIPVRGDGVLRPPIGVWRGEIPMPVARLEASTNAITAITDPSGRNHMMLWTETQNRILYLSYDGTSWSGVKSIALDRVNAESAVTAMKKLLVSQ